MPAHSLEDVLANADMVSIHVPAQADGSAVIGEAQMKAMKPHAILVNAARGGSVDEDALMAALTRVRSRCRLGRVCGGTRAACRPLGPPQWP